MIFLSAQPDEIYFLWQLQLQLDNFHSQGIPADQIHVLIGYLPGRGIHPAFQAWTEENDQARFFFYADTRIRRTYPSSIRPHLIAQHFTQHPEMEAETIFYHDSDILFHHQPDWSALLTDETWYVSDTRSYLDTAYIQRCIGQTGFLEMCRLLSISPDCVRANDREAGGAQYLLKNCPAAFWRKAENDCENLYLYLRRQAGEHTLNTPEHPENTILYWCTDLWVMWWNALLWGKTYRISPLLDFCWPKDPLETWKEKPILHYAGKVEPGESATYFRKGNYREYPPFYDDFSSIRPDCCSVAVVRQIVSYRQQLDARRPALPDTTFLVLKSAAVSSAQAETSVRYLTKYLDAPVCIATPGEEAARIARQIKTPFLVVLQADSIVPIPQLMTAVERLREKNTSAVIPYDGTLHTLDPLSAYLFSKIADTGLWEENKGKYLTTYSRETEAEAFLINREMPGPDFPRLLAASADASSLFPAGDVFTRWQAAGLSAEPIEGAVYNFNLQKLKRS